jgi:hypothetical protein
MCSSFSNWRWVQFHGVDGTGTAKGHFQHGLEVEKSAVGSCRTTDLVFDSVTSPIIFVQERCFVSPTPDHCRRGCPGGIEASLVAWIVGINSIIKIKEH